MKGRCEYLFCRPPFNDFSPQDYDNSLSKCPRNLDIVRRHDHRHGALFLSATEKVNDRVPRLFVYCTRWLVGNQQLGTGKQRHRCQHPLRHPNTELMRERSEQTFGIKCADSGKCFREVVSLRHSAPACEGHLSSHAHQRV